MPDEDPNKHELGDARAGKEVFRSETFGNEAFWTDAVRLPQGVMAEKAPHSTRSRRAIT